MIDAELAAFLEGGVSIYIATRDGALAPNGARAAAVKVDPDGRHLTAYVPTVAAGPILADLEANGKVALVFGRPTDDRACQVKGEFIGARPASARHRPLVTRQWEALLNELTQIGYARETTEAWATWPAHAIRLRVTALFSQTPGPDAGAPLP